MPGLLTRFKIVVAYDRKPVPFRNNDWEAFVDGEEETGVCGYGETAMEAVEDLMETLDQEDRV